MFGSVATRAIRALLVLPLLSACSSPLFKSSRVDANYTPPAAGQMYALPKGYVVLAIERKVEANKPATLTVTMSPPEFVPDTDYIYLLKYDRSDVSSDKVKIETNERGLISGVTTTSKDPLPAAIRELANFIIGVATSGITAGTPLSGGTARPRDR